MGPTSQTLFKKYCILSLDHSQALVIILFAVCLFIAVPTNQM